MKNMIEFAARVFLAHIFLLAGASKIVQYEGTAGYMESVGVPGALLPLVILLEIGGGLALVAGLMTRWAALALAIFCVATAVIFHNNFADQMQMTMFMKNWAIAGGLLLLTVYGAGEISVDHKLHKQERI